MKNETVKQNLKLLDALRGIASIYVLVGHARWLLWEGYEKGYKLHPASYTLPDKVGMYFFTLFKFGHEAVLFFFVLSGFVIHWSVSKRIDRDGKFDVKFYLVRRFKRIYPPLLVAIIFTFLFDKIGLSQHLPIYFSNTPYESVNQNIHPVLTWQSLFGNLFFLQTVYSPVWGTNGALWSLMYEWWFYILYIPVIFAFRKQKILTSLIILIIWFINMEFHVGPLLLTMVLNYFIAWYIGVLLSDLVMYRSMDVKWPIGYLLIVCILSLFKYNNGPGKDIILAVLITVFLYFVLTTTKFVFFNKFQKLANFSYTLYVVHLPLVCLLGGYVMKINDGFLPMHPLYVMGGILIAIPFAWVLHFIVEKPFTTKHITK